jgi:D-3-phosphoglycerate dehydrogenase
MGTHGVNIANFTLGRAGVKEEAIALLYVDEPMPADAIKALQDTGMFQQVKPLTFDV